LVFWLWHRQILFRWGLLKKGVTVCFFNTGRRKEKIPTKTRALLLNALLTSTGHARTISKKGARQSSLTLQLQPLPSTKTLHTDFTMNQPVQLYRQNEISVCFLQNRGIKWINASQKRNYSVTGT